MKFYNIKNTAKVALLVALPLLAAGVTSCQNKEYESFPVAVQPINKADVKCEQQGDNYVISWPALAEGQKMQVTRCIGSTVSEVTEVEGTQYVHADPEESVEYTYILKIVKTIAEDKKLYSTGVVISNTRPGAYRISGLGLSQVDKLDGYDLKVEWNKNDNATKIYLNATNGNRKVTETLDGNATSFIIDKVIVGEEWNVTVQAENETGSSKAQNTKLAIGKTQIGFLSIYETPEELVKNGDDDEASAWLWLHSEYETAKFVYFGDIKNAEELDKFRVLFWIRDLEYDGDDQSPVFTMPDVVMSATPAIKEWYKKGGSLLLWSHAMPYVETIGRVPAGTIQSNDRTIGTGFGSWNGDTWSMAVSAYPGHSVKIDFSNHPIYRGFDIAENADCKLIPFKGPGWTEDHNCLFFNWPGQLTGKSNEDRACYDIVTSEFGIYPLGVWDSQIWWIGQLNVWEAQQGNTEFKGTILCIGNGGCEFSMKNGDGTPDKSAYPTNNIYQDNVLRLAKNSLEYLKTR